MMYYYDEINQGFVGAFVELKRGGKIFSVRKKMNVT